jgi:hypothetical protein
MREQSERRNEVSPYWNFWRVILAGWLIRHPGKMLKPLGILIGFLIVIIYNALTS